MEEEVNYLVETDQEGKDQVMEMDLEVDKEQVVKDQAQQTDHHASLMKRKREDVEKDYVLNVGKGGILAKIVPKPKKTEWRVKRWRA